MTTVYALIIDDRHADTDVQVYTDRTAAIDAALNLAAKYAHRDEDIEILDVDGFEAYIGYSVESDHITVVARELRT